MNRHAAALLGIWLEKIGLAALKPWHGFEHSLGMPDSYGFSKNESKFF